SESSLVNAQKNLQIEVLSYAAPAHSDRKPQKDKYQKLWEDYERSKNIEVLDRAIVLLTEILDAIPDENRNAQNNKYVSAIARLGEMKMEKQIAEHIVDTSMWSESLHLIRKYQNLTALSLTKPSALNLHAY